MSEETMKMLYIINDKVQKCKKDNNVNTILGIPLGGHGEFGYLTDKMLEEIIQACEEKGENNDK